MRRTFMLLAALPMLCPGCAEQSPQTRAEPEAPLPPPPQGADAEPADEIPLATQIRDYMERLADAGFAGAVLVARGDEVVFEAGYGVADESTNSPITAQTVFDSGSLSKQFTVAAVLHLAQAGELQPDTTVGELLQGAPSDKASITVHQLLTHSSGLPQYVYPGDFEPLDRTEAQTLAFEAELEFEPGERYLYSDTGYGLLAIVVEELSGTSLQDYLARALFEPAGMAQTGFYNDPKWAESAVAHGYWNDQDTGSAATRPGPYWGLLGFGGVLTTVGDLQRWSRALRRRVVLDEASVEALFTPHIEEGPGAESFYGYGWVVSELPNGVTAAWHDGATDSHNSFMAVALDDDETTVAVLSNRIVETFVGDEFREVFFATETGIALALNITAGNFDVLPPFAEP